MHPGLLTSKSFAYIVHVIGTPKVKLAVAVAIAVYIVHSTVATALCSLAFAQLFPRRYCTPGPGRCGRWGSTVDAE